jgi:hypothetical protein
VGEANARREYDDLMPLVELRIAEASRDTRHSLRSELATLSALVASGQAMASKEHAEAQLQAARDRSDHQAAIIKLTNQIQPLLDLPDRVEKLERNDDVATALHKTLWKMGGFFVAVVGAFSALLIFVLS